MLTDMKNIFQKSHTVGSGVNTRLDFIAMKFFLASQCKTPHNHWFFTEFHG
jgi:hypothetical protein